LLAEAKVARPSAFPDTRFTTSAKKRARAPKAARRPERRLWLLRVVRSGCIAARREKLASPKKKQRKPGTEPKSSTVLERSFGSDESGGSLGSRLRRGVAERVDEALEH
jgi:hypothetical protein